MHTLVMKFIIISIRLNQKVNLAVHLITPKYSVISNKNLSYRLSQSNRFKHLFFFQMLKCLHYKTNHWTKRGKKNCFNLN